MSEGKAFMQIRSREVATSRICVALFGILKYNSTHGTYSAQAQSERGIDTMSAFI